MPKNLKFLLFLALIFNIAALYAQEKSSGPVITEYGEVFAIDNADFEIDINNEYKAVFDIMNSPDSHSELNKSIETAARFLNMHVQSGVPAKQLKVALVVHNAASKDIITNAAYTAKYGVDNPNEKLIKALLEANAEIIFCGQSSKARGFPKEELIDGVHLSLSAMTALISLQDQGYRLIKF